MVFFSKVDFEKETKDAPFVLLCSNISISFQKPQAMLWNLSQLLLYIIMLNSSNMYDFDRDKFCWSCVSVKHMMSLLLSLLWQAKSTVFLFKDLILTSFIIKHFLSTKLSFFRINMLLEHSLLYSAKAQGFALIALSVNKSRIYNPAKHGTLLRTTYICTYNWNSSVLANESSQLFAASLSLELYEQCMPKPTSMEIEFF